MSKTITGADGKEYLIEPEANLSDAYLIYADLSGADLTNIKYTDFTIWPESFEPPVKHY